ncbi:MAG: family 78 glycoside hydrolase catalytic domain [Bacteroidales bacterium]|nr:family 78 glycoside hydrolase catalytic domain [Bacteroidales bacterium]
MRKVILLILVTSFLISGTKEKSVAKSDIWSNAQWIALELLQKDMLVVPGVHGWGDQLANKGLKRSIVPMFRKEFNINGSIESASINICGLGHYELYINKHKIGDRFLSPGWTNYQKRSLYNSFDITEQIKEGGNAIGVLVGNGFYNINRERYRKLVIAYGYPKLIFNIQIKFKDGSVKNIVSDGDCKVTPSPITFSSIYGGEDYNATLEQEGWSRFSFDDSKWQKPVLLGNSIEKLFPEEDYPLKVMEEFLPQKISTSKTGRTIYDFGQNASGIISLKVKGYRGTQIIIRPDELIDEKGNITQSSGGGPYEFKYTLKGEGIEEWQPKFTYYGFRYADVEIIEPRRVETKTELIEIKMLHTRNSSPTVGSFSCSDTLFNQIFELINWGMKSNMASVATDCPHREKLGWLEQTYLIGPSMHYNFDIHILYSKIVTDMIDSQLENGLVPDIAPEYVPFKGGFRDSPEWGSASVIIPWQLYKWYGDKEVLEKAYLMMKRYVDYLQNKSKNHLLDHGLGDWYDLGPKHPGEAQLTPRALTATTIYYHDLLIVAHTTKILGHRAESKKYMDLAEKVKGAFQNEFYNPKTGLCSTGSQTSYAMALYTGILPKTDKEKVFKNLVDSIKQNNYALTSGDIGYHFLVRVLSENGRSDILYEMNNRSDRPGYGYQVKKGATSLTESWSALSDVSNNHMMLGHLMEWFYTGLGGIYQDENSFAYNSIIIAPKPVGSIKWAKCYYNSPQGKILSEWEIEENSFSLKIEVPKTTTAKIIIPEDYKNSTIEILNISTQNLVSTQIKSGAFDLKSGEYKITAIL